MNKEYNKEIMTEEAGLAAIMAILEGCPEVEVAPIATQVPKTPDMVYDGKGNAVAINNTPIATGKKRRTSSRPSTPRDGIRKDILDTLEVLFSKTKAFEGKLGRNKQEGLVIRMDDADYAVKVQGHNSCGFAPTVEGFKAERSFVTRGKNVVNHSSGIAKQVVFEIENGNLKMNLDFQIFLCEAKASGIRIQILEKEGGEPFECTIKITKKNSRVVLG